VEAAPGRNYTARLSISVFIGCFARRLFDESFMEHRRWSHERLFAMHAYERSLMAKYKPAIHEDIQVTRKSNL
jgi:hypothetical protein